MIATPKKCRGMFPKGSQLPGIKNNWKRTEKNTKGCVSEMDI